MNLSNKKALIGIIMPLTIKAPVVSHCAVDAETFISVIMLGRAGGSKVTFSTVINPPNTIIAIIRRFFFVSPIDSKVVAIKTPS